MKYIYYKIIENQLVDFGLRAINQSETKTELIIVADGFTMYIDLTNHIARIEN